MRVIRIQEVCAKIAVSRTSLWRLSKHTDFPRPIQLGGRIAGFFEHEIDAWLEVQVAIRPKAQRGQST